MEKLYFQLPDEAETKTIIEDACGGKTIDDWQHADIDKGKMSELRIIFKMEDLVEWFSDMDRQWLQVNFKEGLVCVSNGGIDYEPEFFGRIALRKI